MSQHSTNLGDTARAAGSMPAALRDLGMSPGSETRRRTHSCSQGSGHAIFEDALASWDAITQSYVFEEGLGTRHCNDCTAGSIPTDRTSFRLVPNRHSILALMRDSRARILRLEKLMRTPHRVPEREVCAQCGAPAPLVDAYAALDRHTGLASITDTFDASSCASCGESDIEAHRTPMSNHERLTLQARTKAGLAGEKAALAEVEDWLARHGHVYGWTPT